MRNWREESIISLQTLSGAARPNEAEATSRQPMTLGNMRRLGVKRLVGYCLNPSCRYEGLIDVLKHPDDAELPSFASRAVCAKCGARGLPYRRAAELERAIRAADRAAQRLRRPRRPPSRSRYKGRWLNCRILGGECVPLLSQFEKFGLGCLLEG